MYKIIHESQHNTSLIGYADNNVLFDNSILDTLESVAKTAKNNPTKKVMITGHSSQFIRSGVGQGASCLSCITHLSGNTKPIFDRQHYFFVSEAGFPWDTGSPFVVGTDNFDHLVLWHAVVKGVTVVDATITLFSVHQAGHESRIHVYNKFPLDSLAIKTWPGHLPCPPAMPHKCIAVTTIIT
jgi:hypothetical protein